MVAFIFIQSLVEHRVANSRDPDQIQLSATFDMDLHCLLMPPGLYGLPCLLLIIYIKIGKGE